MEDTTQEIVQACIRKQEWAELARIFEKLHPADISDAIENTPLAEQTHLFKSLPEALKPDVLAEIDKVAGALLLEDLTPGETAAIVEVMAPDDAADLLAEMDEEEIEDVLRVMKPAVAETVRELLLYEEDTAGGIMNTEFVALYGTQTAAQAIQFMRTIETDEPIYSAYVVNPRKQLVGYVSLWDLLRNENSQKRLSDLAETAPYEAHTDTDQEEAAQMMSKYDLTSLPVLDENRRIVGRITIDDVVDVLEEEASEDIFRLAGSTDEELEYSNPLQACRARLPWLLITLATGFLTSMILKGFMQRITVSEVLVLSFFVPIVLAMGGNTGIQSSTLIIRGIAIGSFNEKKLYRLLFRELANGLLMGAICGLAIGGWARFVISGAGTAFSAGFLALTVGVALCLAMMFAAVFGATVPILLHHFKIDPAVASGPFVTSSNDIFALLIYYGVTFLLVTTQAA